MTQANLMAEPQAGEIGDPHRRVEQDLDRDRRLHLERIQAGWCVQPFDRGDGAVGIEQEGCHVAPIIEGPQPLLGSWTHPFRAHPGPKATCHRPQLTQLGLGPLQMASRQDDQRLGELGQRPRQPVRAFNKEPQ